MIRMVIDRIKLPIHGIDLGRVVWAELLNEPLDSQVWKAESESQRLSKQIKGVSSSLKLDQNYWDITSHGSSVTEQ